MTRRMTRRMTLRLAGAGAVGLTLALGITVVQSFDGADIPAATASAPAWVPVAGVEHLAERATAASARTTDTYPRADQWLYTKSRIYVPGKEGTQEAGETQTHERWQRGDGAKMAIRHTSADADKGAPPVGPVTAGPVENSTGQRWAPAYLSSLPLDPAALKERLRQNGADRPDLPAARTLFQQVQQILQDGAPPPRLRAALYTVVSELEGVGLEENVRDLADREGVGIYLDSPDGTRHEIIVDPETYAYLGGRRLALGDGERTSQAAGGEVMAAWVQEARGIVDRAGDLP
ncbi:CU044_5270 family protein [Nonomuraea antimicrobica]